MEERYLRLLKLVLSLGYEAIEKMYRTMDYCEDVRNDYYEMVEILGEKLGIELHDYY